MSRVGAPSRLLPPRMTADDVREPTAFGRVTVPRGTRPGEAKRSLSLLRLTAVGSCRKRESRDHEAVSFSSQKPLVPRRGLRGGRLVRPPRPISDVVAGRAWKEGRSGRASFDGGQPLDAGHGGSWNGLP